MKIIYVLLILLIPLVRAEESALDTGLRGELTLDLASDLEEFAELDDRIERCTRKLGNAFPNKQARAEEVCQNWYQNYDNRMMDKQRIQDSGLRGEIVEKISALKEERRLRIQSLDQEQIDRLAELDQDKLERLSMLKQERLRQIADLDESQLQRLALLTRDQIREYDDLEANQWKERLAKTVVAKGRVQDVGRKRDLSESRIEDAREQSQQSRRRFQERKEDYQESRQEFLDLVRKEKQACDTTGAECDAARQESIKQAKEFLNNLAEQELAFLRELKANIQGNEGYSNSDASDQIATIDEQIKKIENAIDLLEQAETKAAVKEAGNVVINTWKRMELQAMDFREEAMYRQAQAMMHRARALEVKADKLLARAETAGYDVTEVEELLDEFSDKISEAGRFMNSGKKLFTEFRQSRSPDKDKLEQAKEQFRNAHQALMEANEIYKQIKSEIFDISGQDLDEESDEQVQIILEKEQDIPEPPEFAEVEE